VSAIRALAEARAADVELWCDGPRVRWRGSPTDELLARLRPFRAEVAEVLRGDRCRLCGGLLPWPGPAGLTYADGTAECMPCADGEAWSLLEAGRRAVESADALADPAELTARGEPLP
jgi:hypothetical protein